MPKPPQRLCSMFPLDIEAPYPILSLREYHIWQKNEGTGIIGPQFWQIPWVENLESVAGEKSWTRRPVWKIGLWLNLYTAGNRVIFPKYTLTLVSDFQQDNHCQIFYTDPIERRVIDNVFGWTHKYGRGEIHNRAMMETIIIQKGRHCVICTVCHNTLLGWRLFWSL